MERAFATPAVAADAAAVTEIVAALESSLYGPSTFSQPDLEGEWSELDIERDARVVRDGDRIVGYGVVRERGERWRVEGYVHPDALGRGIGTLIATGLDEDAARGGADRLRVAAFDPEGDALAFHAAHQEAFADHWDYTPRDFATWSKDHLASERFDPTLWCVVRAGDEIAAGTICTGDTYGGGFVHALFTRRPWRKQGVGAALLGDVFARFWERGEHSVGLGVDAQSDTGAFRIYERAGMAPALGWVTYEKEPRNAA
jgi:GNAT superfamily N-acetyltransferase